MKFSKTKSRKYQQKTRKHQHKSRKYQQKTRKKSGGLPLRNQNRKNRTQKNWLPLVRDWFRIGDGEIAQSAPGVVSPPDLFATSPIARPGSSANNPHDLTN